MGASPIQVVAYFTPMTVCGIIISTVGGFIFHLVSGTVLLVVALTCWILAPLLFALAPRGAMYWAWIFPSTICGTIGIDIIFNIANIFITTSLPSRRQGVAGALINVITQLAVAIGLAWADVVASATADQGQKQSYQNAFWLEVACAAFSFVVLVGFVKIDRAKSDLTVDEKEASRNPSEITVLHAEFARL